MVASRNWSNEFSFLPTPDGNFEQGHIGMNALLTIAQRISAPVTPG